MSNRRNLPIERNNTHFVLGAVAAGLALALPRNNAWQKPLAAAAAFEFGMALLRAPHPASRLEEDVDEAVAPELTRSAMIDGVLMRWEEHGGGKGDDVPVVMVHGILTNPRIWRYIIPRLTSGGVRCLAWEQVGFGWSLGEGLGRGLVGPLGLANQLRHMSAYDTLQIGSRLRRFDIPARVVWGEEDPLGEWSGALPR